VNRLWLMAVLGAAGGFGLVLGRAGLQRRDRLSRERPAADGLWLARLTAAVVVGVVVGWMTRWPVAAVAAALGGWYAIGLGRGGSRDRRRDLARMEAVAGWAEQLRDTLSAGVGIAGTIVASAEVAPLAIRPEVRALALRLNHRPAAAFREFAEAVDDPVGDLVAAVLETAMLRTAREVPALLGELAELARERVQMRERLEAKRAATFTEARWIMIVTVGLMALLLVMARQFLDVYDRAAGQLVLVGVVVLFGGGLSWIARLSRFDRPVRVLAGEPVEDLAP
jgi:tight adherence protein B